MYESSKIGGTLVFKWSDCQVNVKKILESIPFKPLFGQQRGTTHWMTFVKFEGGGRMIPKYRAWDKETQTMLDVSLIDFKKSVLVGEHWEFGETNFINFDDVNLMQSTGLFDKTARRFLKRYP